MRPSPSQIEQLLNLEGWAKSWAREASDEELGDAIVRLLRPFLEHLAGQELALSTLRRHKNNLYLIGGRALDEMTRFEEDAPGDVGQALEVVISSDAGPLLRDASDDEQRACDSTARQLYRFRQRQAYGDSDWA
jgi:hypothetical protein